MPSRYPLSWPAGVSRTTWQNRRKSQFDSDRTVPQATRALNDELARLGASGVILSTNVELNSYGDPRGGRRAPDDPAAAVYFKLRGKDYCFPCDRWNRVPDNIYAIAKHIEAMRGQERWGVGSIEQAFRGYQALHAPGHQKPWREVLGFHADDHTLNLESVEEGYRRLAKRAHPDAGGSHERMSELNRAIEEARQELG